LLISSAALILCDPPLEKAKRLGNNKSVIAMSGEPYQGGYTSFIPPPSNFREDIKGPPRTSMLDDLCFYFIHHTDHLGDLSDPSSTSLFLKKIILAHWVKLLDYFEGVLRKLRDSEWRQAGLGDYDSFRRGEASEQWSSLHVASHRLAEHIDELERTIVQLGIPLARFDNPEPHSQVGKACDQDFLYLHHRFSTLKRRTDNLVNSAIGLAGIVSNKTAIREAELSLREARRSIREAKNVKVLTVIAMFFIPLAFTSGLFSMSDRFSPGSDQFWVFWAVSVPLVLSVFVVAWVMQLGYDDAAVWSAATFVDAIRGLTTRRGRGTESDESGRGKVEGVVP
jgi:CorA-like Mg2+ transporter protein